MLDNVKSVIIDHMVIAHGGHIFYVAHEVLMS